MLMDVNLMFEVHQPFRLKLDGSGYDDSLNENIFRNVAHKCYYPATSMFLELVDTYRKEKRPFRLSFSITGTWMEQAEKWEPDLLEMFRSFPKRNVEFLAETYYHSLSSLWVDLSEFEEQVKMHKRAVKDYFGRRARVFRNTELIYNNRIAEKVREMKFSGMVTEGVPYLLGWRKPTYLYRSLSGLPLLLRHRSLTDDVGYRFSARWWSEWPLTADKYATWLAMEEGDVINIYMDYETIGEHQWEDTGIFLFFRYLPEEAVRRGLEFTTPSESIKRYRPVGELDVFEYSTISWADMEMDVSAWLGNDMQLLIFNELQAMEKDIKRRRDKDLLMRWRKMLTSDHLHNVSTKNWSDGDVHKYFSYFSDPVQGFAVLTKALLNLQKEARRK